MLETTSIKGKPVKDYFTIEANLLYQRYRTFESLLPSADTKGAKHRGEEGRYIEALLRDFLNRYLPSEIRALSGFIYRPSTKTDTKDRSRLTEDDAHSTQIDVIIFDEAHYPVFERFQEVAIVPPEGVVGLISVKKKLYSDYVEHELQCLKSASLMCREEGVRQPHTAIFAFTNGSMNKDQDKCGEQMYKYVDAVYRGANFSTAVNEITILDKLVLFKWDPTSSGDSSATYQRVDCLPSPTELPISNIAIQRMLQSIMSVYYARAGRKRPGYVSFEKGTFNRDIVGHLSVVND